MNIPFSPPDITEEEIQEVADTLRSGWITTGPKTKEFERQIAAYCQTKKAVCLSSATACMEMTLRLFGIGPGDEVITTAYTYTATASSICHTGAKPVVVDTGRDSFEMDYDSLEKYITPATKAIMPVDLAGIPCDYEKIYEIIEKKKELYTPGENRYQKAMGRILVLSDCAHGFGARLGGRPAGQFSDFTAFSFHAVKNLTTAEGGAVVWKEFGGIDPEEIYREYMLLSLHGQSKDALAKTKAGAWEYDIVSPAYKCNMTDLQASLGLIQLKRYSGILARRREIIEMYDRGLARINEKGTGFRLQGLRHFEGERVSSGHLYLMRICGYTREQRDDLIVRLAEKGVASNVHYKPLPMLTAYKKMGMDVENYPNAFHMFENELTLPLHTLLTDEQIRYVLETLEDCLL
ncbi:MAG: DegT/DnrJ/EryC1/StrS family aminotransferase [Roseburia sp.]|nr:DegT/DnrJ/EryC1/StrS family aminotransferase [Roseburia sp.]